MYRFFLDRQSLVNEKQLLAKRLLERNQEIEAASASKTAFLAAASHDLRQPLHAMSLFVETLAARPLGTHEQKLVQNIDRSVQALDDMFRVLLDISRLDGGAVTARIEPVALQPIFDRLTLAFAGPASSKGLRFRIAATTCWILVDRVLIEELLRNLVANAVRYTATGGVLVGVRRRGTHLSLQVHDSGIGIPELEQNYIFKEFVQLNNPSRDRRLGMGLGLSIVERIAAILGSKVSVISEVGRGSCFSLALPHAAAEDSNLTVERGYSSSQCDLQGLAVLVLEDDGDVQQAITALLESWGATVFAAAKVDLLITEAATLRAPPALIISDYRLGNNDTALTAITKIHEEWNAEIPALIVTGDISIAVVKEISSSGFTFLPKPVRAQELQKIINVLLRSLNQVG